MILSSCREGTSFKGKHPRPGCEDCKGVIKHKALKVWGICDVIIYCLSCCGVEVVVKVVLLLLSETSLVHVKAFTKILNTFSKKLSK